MTYDILPIPRIRGLAVAALQVASRRHIVHGFLEVDVTVPRRILNGTSGTDAHPLSFTGFVIACYARAIHDHPIVQAYRDLRNRLIVFHDVDISMIIEHRKDGVPIPYVIRNAHSKSVREISEEIRAAYVDPHPWGRLEGSIALLSRFPHFFQVLFFRCMALNPHWIKKIDGTAQVSSFGMFSKRAKWGVGLLYSHTMGLWVGGISETPLSANGDGISLRQCVHLTISFNHDIVDGGPVALFSKTFIDLLESGSLLDGEAT